MKTCDFCGNPVANHLKICPYCNQNLAVSEQMPKLRNQEIEIINLEAGMPFVKEALARFDSAFSTAQNRSVGLLKIIHGYGSSGKGGKIKIAIHQHLKVMLANQQISKFIIGENYSKSSQSVASHLKLIEAYPELIETIQADKYNPGICFVEL